MNYYNDNDPFMANWIKCLIRDGFIPPGKVDERNIEDVQPQDLEGFTQCHFFAGIAGWPVALKIAGWPPNEPVWTGSCPCQPLSVAGKQLGEKDERHLWPEFYRLISQCRPVRIFGEQSESPDGIEWLDGISLDLEEIGYAVGSVDLPSASVGAPNKRQRAWWVSDSHKQGRNRRGHQRPGKSISASDRTACKRSEGFCSHDIGLANPNGSGQERGQLDGRKVHAGGIERRTATDDQPTTEVFCEDGRMGKSEGKGLSIGKLQSGNNGKDLEPPKGQRLIQAGFWNDSIPIRCRDKDKHGRNKWRRIPTQSVIFPLAPRIPGRVGLLRGAGNAINPWVAAEFIKAFMET